MISHEGKGVSTPHKQYVSSLPRWKQIKDILESDCDKYLRDVGASESDSEYGKKRQKDYVDGAILYNFTVRTADGMVGAVYQKEPTIELRKQLLYLLTDADGSGVGLEQQSKATLTDTLTLGRAGLLSDMPTASNATIKDQEDGKINPRILYYSAENIINWRVKKVGAINQITMIVLREEYEYSPTNSEFDIATSQRYRVLELVDGIYRQRLFTFEDSSDKARVEIFDVKANGKPMHHIPFTFIGSENNSFSVDRPPFYPLTLLNIGHYRNSADNEESSFIVGQPTLFIMIDNQIDAKQFQEANPNGIKFGSRQGYNLGQQGKAQLLQAQPNNLSKENMKEKEAQAVQIGAQLISPSQQITAESARIQRGADTSVLTSVARNVSEAYQMHIEWCGDFLGVDTKGDQFILNTDYFLQTLTAQDRAQWVSDINQGLFPASEYYAAMRRAGQIERQDDEITDELLDQGISYSFNDNPEDNSESTQKDQDNSE